jgi:hypothetical protein
MPNFQALGTSPVSFLDTNQSQQSIPLSAISFAGSVPSAAKWPKYSSNSALIDALLAEMVNQGLLTQGTAAASSPSLTITAAVAGAPGNSITVTFANAKPTATPPTIDVKVAATEIYANLTLATLPAALGTSSATASGMIFVNGAVNSMPVAQSGAIGADFNFLFADAAADAAGAFTVTAVDETPDSADINVAITIPAGAPAGTFTLTATYANSQAGQTVAALTTAATNPFAAVVTFTGPASAALPAPGTVTLMGGAAPSSSAAVPAVATVFSS